MKDNEKVLLTREDMEFHAGEIIEELIGKYTFTDREGLEEFTKKVILITVYERETKKLGKCCATCRLICPVQLMEGKDCKDWQPKYTKRSMGLMKDSIPKGTKAEKLIEECKYMEMLIKEIPESLLVLLDKPKVDLIMQNLPLLEIKDMLIQNFTWLTSEQLDILLLEREMLEKLTAISKNIQIDLGAMVVDVYSDILEAQKHKGTIQ